MICLFFFQSFFGQQVEKEIIIKVCIDGEDKLHLKDGQLFWEHITASPPGMHTMCDLGTNVNDSIWKNWHKPYDLGINTDSLVSSKVILKRSTSKLIQTPSKENGYETIWYFNDPEAEPRTYSISLVYYQEPN